MSGDERASRRTRVVLAHGENGLIPSVACVYTARAWNRHLVEHVKRLQQTSGVKLIAYLLAEHHFFLDAVKKAHHPHPNHPNLAMVGSVSTVVQKLSSAWLMVVPMELSCSLHEYLMRLMGLAHIELMFYMIDGREHASLFCDGRVCVCVFHKDVRKRPTAPQKLLESNLICYK